MRIPLRQLSRAATKLHRSQPAVSLTIGRPEEGAGRAAVRNARCIRQSTLTIGAEEWMLVSFAPLLAAFRQAHQDVRVDLRIQEPSHKMGDDAHEMGGGVVSADHVSADHGGHGVPTHAGDD